MNLYLRSRRKPPEAAEGYRGPHVCMIVHSQYPVGEPRGERHAKALAEAGYDVHVICLRLPGQPKVTRVDGIQITRLPVRHLRGVNRLRMGREYISFTSRAALATLDLHRRRPIDVVYVHAPPDLLILTALLPRLLGVRVVLDIHDLTPHMYDARFGGRHGTARVVRALQFGERRACALADWVITVHEPYRRELAANRVDPAKIVIVMNGPDEAEIDRAKELASNRNTADTFTVAYHGTVTRWYGVDLFIRAIAELDQQIPNLRAVVLGEGDELEEVERIARSSGLEHRVEFSREYLPHLEALSAVAGASCGVIPNRRSRLNRFALSSKLLEYVALGVPVVVSRLETLAAHFGPDEVTFFDPDDAGALADAIRWVAENPVAARERARCASERAQEYAWHRSHSRLLKVISSVTSHE